MIELYGYIDEEKGLMVISDTVRKESQNTIIALCSEDEVVEYSANFVRESYREYIKRLEKSNEEETK